MADEKITLEQIQQAQAELQELAEQAQDEDMDNEQRLALCKELSARAAKLESQAMAFQAQQLGLGEGEAPPEPRSPWILVELTPDQRARIADRLGVRVEAVKISDAHADLSQAMPEMPPAYVEAMAYRYARVVRQLKDSFAELQQNASPETMELVRLVMRDESLTRPIHENLLLEPGELDFLGGGPDEDEQP